MCRGTSGIDFLTEAVLERAFVWWYPEYGKYMVD